VSYLGPTPGEQIYLEIASTDPSGVVPVDFDSRRVPISDL
jgi:hypothetical protein